MPFCVTSFSLPRPQDTDGAEVVYNCLIQSWLYKTSSPLGYEINEFNESTPSTTSLISLISLFSYDCGIVVRLHNRKPSLYGFGTSTFNLPAANKPPLLKGT